MPEEPTPPESSSLPPDAEWTDESAFLEPETAGSPAAAEPEPLPESEDAAAGDWEDEFLETPVAQATTTREALAWLQPVWRSFKATWRRLIAGIRQRIPATAQWSDAVISSILIGSLGVLLLIFNSLHQPSVAVDNPPEQVPANGTDVDPTAVPQPPVTSPAPAIAPGQEPSATEVAVSGDRIAKLQAQLTDSAIPNANQVIDTVSADFAHNRLTLVFKGDWFRLSDYEQAELARQLMAQSQDLAFEDLQFVTLEGDLIARSPVVGDAMVILLGEKPPAVEPPERPRYRITVDR